MSRGPMADYPHASAACLCYLDEREGGEQREKAKDAGHLMFSLFFLLLCWTVHTVPLLLAILKLARERKRARGRRGERVSGPKSAV